MAPSHDPRPSSQPYADPRAHAIARRSGLPWHAGGGIDRPSPAVAPQGLTRRRRSLENRMAYAIEQRDAAVERLEALVRDLDQLDDDVQVPGPA